MGWEHFTASDGFAIGMIVVIASGFGVILSLFVSMNRHAKRRNQAVDDLIQELNQEEQALRVSGSRKAGSTDTWERDGDWWKKP